MNELHSQGKTIEDIVQVLNRTPIHPRIVPAIEAAYSLGYHARIDIKYHAWTYFEILFTPINFYPFPLLKNSPMIV